ncbi:GNAT family N-acetyltransferase [Shouchella lehensis]|uniref:Acyltransferase n=3 Tax=Shouchella lehensis TaxID=300825 RepID=A0A060LRI9_9BACI|nr:GNAT family N-acetyltransferase [Shouchella lehensis]AIC92782.1 acyltransferase [Shouchella lehensis G1]RQW22401.1 N-acetyltransferase [Bacillus sp. C1-1]TES49219.1 N-acetyltransferase [Shouchella lehensis]
MRFVAMTEDQAKWIAYQWQYKGAYSFFHDEKNSRTTSFLEFGKKNTWQYAVYRENEIIGFIGVKRINGMIEIAPGLNPEETGKGKGRAFVQKCVDFLKAETNPEKICVLMGADNTKAKHVFEEVGFEEKSEEDSSMIRMIYSLND